jgi:hypothetical protein
MLVIGAPSWFSGVLAAMRALLTPEQQARMEVIPGDYRPRLRELIGAENLLVGVAWEGGVVGGEMEAAGMLLQAGLEVAVWGIRTCASSCHRTCRIAAPCKHECC